MFEEDEKEEEDEIEFAFGPRKNILGEQKDIVVSISEKVEGIVEKATRKLKTEKERLEAKR